MQTEVDNTTVFDLGGGATGGIFTRVANIDTAVVGTVAVPPLDDTTALPTWVTAGGNVGGKQYLGASSRHALSLSGAGNAKLSFVEGQSVSIAAGTSYNKGIVINTIGGSGTNGAVTVNGTLTIGGVVAVYSHGGNFALGSDATIATGTPAPAPATAPTPTVLLNLGGVDNGGAFINNAHTFTTGNKDLTVLAGSWTLTTPTPVGTFKAIDVGSGKFSEGGFTSATDFTIDSGFNYQGGADVLLGTQGGLINATGGKQDNNITATTGDIVITGINGMNLGTASIIAKTGTIKVTGNAVFATTQLTLKTEAAGKDIAVNGALSLYNNGNLVLNSAGAISEAYSVKVGRKTVSAIGSISAGNVTIANAKGLIEMSGGNAIDTIVSISQLAARTVGAAITANSITINNNTALSIGDVKRVDASGAEVTTTSTANPAGDISITTNGTKSNLTLTRGFGQCRCLDCAFGRRSDDDGSTHYARRCPN